MSLTTSTSMSTATQINTDAPLPDPAAATATSDLEDLAKEEELVKRELIVLGHDLGSVPCFRNSFLYGISGGIGSGIAHFAVSSRVPAATKFGFYSYVAITLGYWVHCRYTYSETKIRYAQLQYAMKQNSMYEGTEKGMNFKAAAEEFNKQEKEKN